MTSNPANKRSSGPSFTQRWIRAYLNFAHKNRLAIVLASLLIAGFGIWCSTKIRLDANLDSLLPRNTETIRAMRETKARFGSTDLYTISIVSDNPDTVARIQDELKAELEKDWPDLVYVQIARDNKFFKEHALLYLPVPYLNDIQNKLKQTQMDLGTQSPLGVDLLSDEPETSEKPAQTEWFNATIPQQLGLPDEAADAFREFFKKNMAGDSAKYEFDPKNGIPSNLRTRLMGKTRDGKTVGLVQAALKYPSSDIDYVKTVLARSKSLLAPIQARYGNKLDIGVEGPYKGFEEVNSLARNGAIATAISVGLNILIIFFFFRGIGPVAIIGLQAILASLITLAAIALTYGRLNLYTVFVIAILFGMGIDFSIYILGHAQKLVLAGRTWKEALEKTMVTLFFSLLVHATTTIAGLLTLRVSKFVGFYEFAFIASIGIGISMLCAFFTMPSFIFMWQGLHEKFKVWPSLRPKKARSWNPAFLKNLNGKKTVRNMAVAVGIGTLILACFIPRVRFEYDFNNLRETGEKKTHDLPVAVALNSHRTSSQPVIVLAKDSAAMVTLYDTLLQRLTIEKDPYLRSFLTLSTFVPPTDQQTERMEYIRRIDTLARARIFDRAKGEDSMMIGRLRELAQTHEFNSSDIPPWSLNLLRERDGSFGKIGFIYGNYSSSDAIDAGHFQDRYGHFDLDGEHLSAFSSSFIFSDIIRLVKRDSVKIFSAMILVLILLLALILHDVRLSLICGIEMVVGMIWILGLMGLFRIKIGVFNLIVISDLQGYSVNLCTYLLLAYLRLGRHRLREIYSDIGVLLVVGTLTTTAGYMGMLFTTHLGIISIGKFAVLGLPTLLITTLGLTPWLCMKLIPDSRIQESHEA